MVKIFKFLSPQIVQILSFRHLIRCRSNLEFVGNPRLQPAHTLFGIGDLILSTDLLEAVGWPLPRSFRVPVGSS